MFVWSHNAAISQSQVDRTGSNTTTATPKKKLAPPALPDWLDQKLPFVRYTVQVDHKKMHVMEHGQGQSVLMVHGNPTWGFLWRKVAQRLDPERFRCIMPDLIGLGLSDKPHEWCSATAIFIPGLTSRFAWCGGLSDPILGGVLGWARKLRPDALAVETMAGHFSQEEVPDELADAVSSLA